MIGRCFYCNRWYLLHLLPWVERACVRVQETIMNRRIALDLERIARRSQEMQAQAFAELRKTRAALWTRDAKHQVN